MQTAYQYIHFVLLANATKRKTSTWRCVSNTALLNLGTVEWYAGWRQYCFYANEFSIFSSGCLADIQDFIKQLNMTHKMKLAHKKSKIL
jgi:hypothetical protein